MNIAPTYPFDLYHDCDLSISSTYICILEITVLRRHILK